MDHAYIEKNHLTDRYVLGQLSEQETGDFEEHFLECQECQETLEQRTALRDGLRLVATEDAAKPARTPLLGSFLHLLPAFPRYALVLGAFVLPAFVVYLIMGKQTSAPVAPRTDTTLMMLDLQRGEPAPSKLEILGDPGLLVLAFPVSNSDYRSYSLEINGPENQVVWRADDLQPNLSGLIVVSVPSDFLTLPSHSVRVSGSSAGGTAILADYELIMKFDH